MQIDYNDFTIKVFGIREYTVHIIFEGRIVLNRAYMLFQLHTSPTQELPIRSSDDGLKLAKEIIDRFGDELKNRSVKNYPKVDRECRDMKLGVSKSRISKPKIDRTMYGF